MIIKTVDVFPYRVPNIRPIKWATGFLPAAEHLLVKITAEDGTYGVSEAIPRTGIYGETQESIYVAIKKYLAPMIIGEDSFNLERIWEKFEALYWNPAAKGAIDVALWDLNGRLLNVNVNKLLGGPYRSEVPLSWQIAFASQDEMIGELKEKTAQGYRSFKVKGGKNPDEDIRLIEKMRAAVPDDVRLYIDANISYSREDTLRVMSALAGKISCMEEPMPPWDTAGRKEVVSHTNIPLLSDESSFTYPDVYNQIREGIIKQIGIKVPRTGISISSKIVKLAEVANVPVQVSLQAECDLGTAAGLILASAFRRITLPCELCYYVDNISDSLITEPLVIKNGFMKVPDGPGMGVNVDWDKIKKYAIELTL